MREIFDEINPDEFKKLTRNELKMVLGGALASTPPCYYDVSCSVSIPNANGLGYQTYRGQCQGSGGLLNYQCFCQTGLGSLPLGSNNGESRCTRVTPD